MKSIVIPFCMTVFFACQGDALPDEHNVENIAMAAMEKAVSGQTSAFVAELDPSNFPLGDGKAFVLEDLLRIRKVDGRFLADFKLNKNGRSLEFSVWFEETASEESVRMGPCYPSICGDKGPTKETH